MPAARSASDVTALLGEVGAAGVPYAGRVHFFATAAKAMRHVLVDHARGRAAAKRGSGATQVPFEEERGYGAEALRDVLVLDDALGPLAAGDARAARVVELRVCGGLTVDEMALEPGVSKRTVDGDGAVGKMWLARALSGGTPP